MRKNISAPQLNVDELILSTAKAITDAGLVTILDANGIIVHASAGFHNLTGHKDAELIGKSCPILRSFSTSKSEYSNLVETVTKGNDWQGEIAIRHTNGTEVWLHTSITPKLNGNGTPQSYICLHQDITERRKAEHLLLKNQIIQTQMQSMSAQWFWETDENHNLRHLSEGFTRTGINPADIIGLPRWRFACEGDRDQWVKHQALLNSHMPFRQFEYKVRMENASLPVWLSDSGDPIFDEAGQFRGYRGIGWETTTERLQQEALWRLANIDPLTNLPNRQLFTETLRAKTTAKPNEAMSLILIDIDDFRSINDSQGNEAGDEILIALALHLKNYLRNGEFISRIASDEFAVIQDGQEDQEGIAASLGRLVNSLHDHQYGPGLSRHSISVGAALHPQDAEQADDLLKNAQIALHRAKENGGNQFALYSTEFFHQFMHKSQVVQDVHKAMDRDEMLLHYQPIMDATNNRIKGVEALLRWSCPQRGVIAPAQFWASFSNGALAARIGRFVLKQAVSQAAQWKQDGVEVGKVAINVTSADFASGNFSQTLTELIQTNGLLPSDICIEVTEGMFLGQTADKVITELKELSRLGVEIAFDDFGTGYASLMHLKLPIDRLKIDRSFVQEIECDPTNSAIVKAVAHLGKDLGKAITVEGVETQGQSDLLREMGCHEQQGYLYSRPLPPDAIPGFIRAQVAAQNTEMVGK